MTARDKLKPDDQSAGLVLAMVCSSPTPLLLLDGDCRVLASSISFCEAFQLEPGACVGRSLFALGTGEWDVPQLRSLMAATVSGDANIEAYETALRTADGETRSVVVSVRKLSYGDDENVRLLVAVLDVTEARAREKDRRVLAYDNAVLSREVRHRVANSLQIIASVMMLNARNTSSEELRGQLRDARNRVMSIADLQRQLAVGDGEAVNLRTYLRKLCDTIGASMIADPRDLVLTVEARDVLVGAEVSVSLGLMVTELVINCLKHGFPDGGGGEIEVAYEHAGELWTLSVTDNGIGMPPVRSMAMAGLGTSIVQALARQLRASVTVKPMNPGTRVSIVHGAAHPTGTDIDQAQVTV